MKLSTHHAIYVRLLSWLAVPFCLAINGPVVPCFADPLGPSTRRGGLVLSEIMYHPGKRLDGLKLSFVEVYNCNPWPEDLTGFGLGINTASYKFPTNTVIGPHSFLVVAGYPAGVMQAYNITNVLGPLVGGLGNNQGRVSIYNPAGVAIFSTTYHDAEPWPVSADGAGHSLVLAHPSYGESDPRAWSASVELGGSPGGPEPASVEPLSGVLLNEMSLFPTSGVTFVEFYNHRSTSADLSGCLLSDGETNGFVIPAGTTVASGGFLLLSLADIGFNLSRTGGKILLYNAARTRVVEAATYPSQAPGLVRGRFPNGSSEWRTLSGPTPGASNQRPPLGEVIISEIAPLIDGSDAGQDPQQWLELYNRTDHDVNIGGWRFTSGITNLFPPHAFIPGGGYLVIVGNTVGGKISEAGEKIELSRPTFFSVTNLVTTNITVFTNYLPVDSADFGAGERIGNWRDYRAPTVVRADFHSDGSRQTAWVESRVIEDVDASSVINFQGLLQFGAGPCEALDILLLGQGEARVDNVEVRELISGSAGPNLVVNGDFESGTNGWHFGGNHERSTVELGGDGGVANHSLHIRSSGRGDTWPNHIRTQLTSPLTPGHEVMIRVRSTWLQGTPEMLFRLKGNWFEGYGRVSYGKGGTRGTPNPDTLPNIGPSIWDVRHEPVLPAANEPVLVQAGIDDPDGITGATLYYRVDPGSNWVALPMSDQGGSNDKVAGDQVYSARLPGQPAGTLVAFYIDATDGYSPSAHRRFPLDSTRECLVRFGEPSYTNGFQTYRFWMTKAVEDRWSTREKPSNEPLWGTFVYGADRAIYGAAGRYNGSPEVSASYTTPKGTLCGYNFVFPKSDPLLGSDQIILDFPIADGSGQREQLSHWFLEQMGIPYLQRTYVNVFINGTGQRERSGFGTVGTLYEDTQQPNSDYLEEWFPTDFNGSLYKSDAWAEYSADGVLLTNIPNTLQDFIDTNDFKVTARYRWNWRPRASGFSGNDFNSLFNLVNGINGYGVDGNTNFFDINTWAWNASLAVNDAVANPESFGNRLGGNTYHYKPLVSGWTPLNWDMDASLGVNGSSVDAPIFDAGDPTIARLDTFPEVRRGYWQALEELLGFAFDEAKVGAWLQNRYNALAPAGLTTPQPLVDFVQQRKAFLASALASASAAWSVHPPDGASYTTNNNLLLLDGTAPFKVSFIIINSNIYNLQWLTVSRWQTLVALQGGSNSLAIAAYDRHGLPIPGMSNFVSIFVNGIVPPAKYSVAINEIYDLPAIPGAEFVELYNHSDWAYDLGETPLVGQSFDPSAGGFISAYFGHGTIIYPGEYFLVAQSYPAFRQEFGTAIHLRARFDGDLSQRHAASVYSLGATENVLLGNTYPWPQPSIGHSLQLIDPFEEVWRPGNWTIDYQGAPTPGGENTLRDDLPLFPYLSINELLPRNTTNLVDNFGEHDPWVELWNAGNAVNLTGFALTDDIALPAKWRFPDGATVPSLGFPLVWMDGQSAQTTNNSWHASFRLASDSGFLVINRHVQSRYVWDIFIDGVNYNNTGIVGDQAYGSDSFGNHGDQATRLDHPTPGGTNADNPNGLFLPLRINEWMASNTKDLDPADGKAEDWFELYNYFTNAVNLEGLLLAQKATDPVPYRIPPGFVIPGGGLLRIWADNQTNQLAPGQLHVNFKLSKGGDSIVLMRANGTLIDQVTFGPQTNDVSEGLCGTLIRTQARPTPGGENRCPDVPLPPFTLTIRRVFNVVEISWPEEYDPVIQCTDDLSTHRWQTLPRSFRIAPNVIQDSFDGRQRYYRAVLP